MADKNINANEARLGLNLDSTITEITPGQLTYAMNAQVEGFDGNSITYQNEQANVHCIDFPEGYKVIGVKNIYELNRVVYFLTNPNTEYSQIGYSDNDACIYNILIDDSKGGDRLLFRVNHPINKVITKTTNCSTQIYWTDGFNPRRYLDFSNLPWKEESNPLDPFNPTKLVGILDANKLLVQPNFSIPTINTTTVSTGGQLKMGTYQFAVQYCNVKGEAYTSFYSVTNPLGIFQNIESSNFDEVTSKSISLILDNLDTTGLYDYFNVAVIKTVNNITSVDLVGTFPITTTNYNYTYTGVEVSPIKLTITDIFEKSPYYDTAQDVFEVDNVIGWSNLTSAEEINYQSIWSNVKIGWETWQLPYNKFEGYNNGINTEKLRSYMRDEVYALEGCFILKNGMQTKNSHIPGRAPMGSDLALINEDNLDSQQSINDICDTSEALPRWKVYNTGSVTDFSDEYKKATNVDCYIGPYQYGDMAYWESTDTYPGNTKIWGDLAGRPIRHHKFPDSVITHIHDNNASGNISFEHKIYPIGIKIDSQSLYDAISASSLTKEQKEQIVGFKIVRGNRASNKSIIAKGIFNNVGEYIPQNVDKDDDISDPILYPNYPYNDIRKDPYFANKQLVNHQGFSITNQLDGFASDSSRSRFVFHSPDTHFYQPSGIDGGFVKMETIEYGESYGHFVKVKRNAEYKFLTSSALSTAAAAAIASMVNVSGGVTGGLGISAIGPIASIGGNVSESTNPANALPTFTSIQDLLYKLAPFANMGYTYNSYGLYNKFYPIPNDEGNKIRAINFGKYLIDGIQTVEGGKLINNYKRESSIYLNTLVDSNGGSLPFPNEYNSVIPEDNSRYNLSSFNGIDNLQEFLSEYNGSLSEIISNSDIQAYLADDALGGGILYSFNYNNLTHPNVKRGDVYAWISKGSEVARFNVVDSFFGPSSVTIGPSFDKGYVLMEVISGTPNNTNSTIAGDELIKISGDPSSFPSISFNEIFDNVTVTTVNLYYRDINKISLFLSDVRKILKTITTIDDLNSLLVEGTSTVQNYLNESAYWLFINAFRDFLLAKGKYLTPEKIRKTNISSYYGSIKRNLLNQWGQIYSYDIIDTGFYSKLLDSNGNNYPSFPTIFGGDIFINRFALKTKVPIFTDNTVNQTDGTDIQYDELGNYGYPMFWYSTKGTEQSIDVTTEVKRFTKTAGSLANILLLGVPGTVSGMSLIVALLKQIAKRLGVKNTNLDQYSTNGYYEKGLIYLFVYGIPYYFVESEVNVDYRQATNALEGNFYPNAGGGIPDEWLQEVNVSISNDNSYFYNNTYSKQNKETYFSHIRADFDPDVKCFTFFPNRTIWSEKSNLEETKNSWLVYKPASFYDFSKSYGRLTSIDKIEEKQLLVRFDNKSQIYNALYTVQTSAGPSAYLGNDKLFSGTPPVDIAETDIGYAGSQHKLLVRTEFGHIFVDSKRGQIILLNRSGNIADIADKGMDKWFSKYLPFTILESFPDIDIDNNFNGIGLHGIYDAFYQRLILTKLDYEPLIPLTYTDGKFYNNKTLIELGDPNYFCNKSWTLSYCFKTNSWTSFHSYQPNYYIGFPNYFQSGISDSLWNHDKTYTSFNSFYGKQEPYILEYPFVYKMQDEILQNIKEYCSARKYSNFNTFYEPQDILYFNKSIIYNSQQCSGILNLVPKIKGNLSTYNSYPKYNTNSKDISLVKSDNFYNYNTFWDIVKDKTKPFFVETCAMNKENKKLDETNLDYTNKDFKKAQFRAKDLKVRHILDNKNDVRLISRFIISPTAISYK